MRRSPESRRSSAFDSDETFADEFLTQAARAGDNTYSFRDVGAEHLQVQPDGTEIFMLIGQIPFGVGDDPRGFTGVMKINLTAGEVILQPQHSIGGVEEACAARTA